MDTTIALVIFLVVFVGVIWFLYRSTQRQVKQVLSGKRSLDDREIWLRHTEPLPARVVSKTQVIKPDAAGIAKVDLELEILPPEGSPIQAKTCWLVEIPNLRQLEPGSTVEVKFDSKRPDRVYPAVPWARIWLFGERNSNRKETRNAKEKEK